MPGTRAKLEMRNCDIAKLLNLSIRNEPSKHPAAAKHHEIPQFAFSQSRNLAILNSGRGVRQRASSNSTLPDSLTFCRDESRPDKELRNCVIAKLRNLKEGQQDRQLNLGITKFRNSAFRNLAILLLVPKEGLKPSTSGL